jgi:hypothetical protein
MKCPKISEAISPLIKSRHSAKTPAAALLGSQPPRQSTIFTSRPSSSSATVFQRIVATILNYGSSNAARVTYFVGGVFARTESGE